MRQYFVGLATDTQGGFWAALIRPLLCIASFLYGAIIRIYLFLSSLKPKNLGVKVISVGNITAGGTGKTLVVEYLVRCLKAKGCKVAILTRGYRRQVIQRTGDPEISFEAMGDEPFMLQQKLQDVPVVVDENRIRGCARAKKEFGADTVVLDDGFQQWRIKKDLEIVTIDARNPFGNRHMLPRGILREPLSSLKRADIFILTKTNLCTELSKLTSELSALNPKASLFFAEHRARDFYSLYNKDAFLPLSALEGKSVGLFSGIGDPASFESLVKSLGFSIGLTFRFSDHHSFTQEELNALMKDSLQRGISTLITTEKDAARLGSVHVKEKEMRILVLRISLGLKDEEGFFNRLHKLYSV